MWILTSVLLPPVYLCVSHCALRKPVTGGRGRAEQHRAERVCVRLCSEIKSLKSEKENKELSEACLPFHHFLLKQREVLHTLIKWINEENVSVALISRRELIRYMLLVSV